ncbi:gamma-glutamylcyclotransferase [Muricauda oceani]|uniref:glutathione-specific gamma-glutamylcyclotransferase n=1 Tax=Flagellimonas oceani TaxID=2698672 RepID=A0A6G7J0N3_9FLAO|nr:gamma-glutamylcyclotransferase [Allomuricauda oceani]MBW8244226.1 gamma-glutamylcyclotransferase [Allomuricauda oceani]QII44124.1 hypothetical protein GVT53_05365 [Allomuricauda oceani]
MKKNSTILIFGYGSIIWDNEDLEPSEIIDAKLNGAHRSFNKKSIVSRGTKENPGLVLGLEYGGDCIGKLIRIPEENYSKVLEREGGYIPKNTGESNELEVVNLLNQKIENCIVFFPNPKGRNYLEPNVDLEEKAKIILKGEKGKRSDSKEYLREIRKYLIHNEIVDEHVEKLYKMVFDALQ